MPELQTLDSFLPDSLRHALRQAGRECPPTRLLLGHALPLDALRQALAALPAKRWLVVADAASWQAAPVWHDFVSEIGRLSLLPAPAKATGETAQQLMEQGRDCDGFLAIGSGSLNDLSKYAAAQTGKISAVYATAASMNGYLSPTASLTVEGHKQSLPAQLPALVMADWQLLAEAPKRMTLAGLGDTLCRTSCAFDQWLAEQLTAAPFDCLPHRWPEMLEPALWQAAPALTEGHAEATRLLFTALLAGGFAMWLAGSSAPASQSEHMLAHLMDMATPSPRPALHGEMIAVTALTSLRLQQQLLKHRPRLYARPADAAGLYGLLDKHTADPCLELYWKKAVSLPDIAELNRRWQCLGPALAADWAGKRPSAGRLKALYQQLGLPTTPREIGWSNQRYRQAVKFAALTRDRFTILDVLYAAG